MSAYGWTLDDAMDITLPQALMLFDQMAKYPPAAMAIGMLVKGLGQSGEQDETHKLASIGTAGGEGGVETAKEAGAAFWRFIGAEKDDG